MKEKDLNKAGLLHNLLKNKAAKVEMIEPFFNKIKKKNKCFENGGFLLNSTENFDLLSFLFENKCDPNIQNDSKKTPFYFACSHFPDEGKIKIFLQNKADLNVLVDSSNYELKTPFSIIFSRDKRLITDSLLKILVEGGANLNSSISGGHCFTQLSYDNPRRVYISERVSLNKDSHNFYYLLANGFNPILTSVFHF